jgi:hypothetical protein
VLDEEFYSSGGSHHYRFTPMRSNFVLDWRDGQVLSGSVIPARLNRQLTFIEQLPERRRLVVERNGEGYRLTNGLGVSLLGFFWRDQKNTGWSSGPVAVGQTIDLSNDPNHVNALPLGASSSEVLVDHRVGDPARKALAQMHANLSTEPVLYPDADLPPGIGNRIGREVGAVYKHIKNQPLTFIATLAAPMDPLPGPSSIDPLPPVVIACGRLPLTGAPEAAP